MSIHEDTTRKRLWRKELNKKSLLEKYILDTKTNQENRVVRVFNKSIIERSLFNTETNQDNGLINFFPWNVNFSYEIIDNSNISFDEDNLSIDRDNDNSTENIINSLRSQIINEKFTQQFISLLKEEDFEFGYATRSENLILEQLQINALATRNWLNEIFIKNFADDKVIIGILRIIGRFDPDQIFPQGQTLALAALNHSNDEIKELGIRAFEKWCSDESLSILKKLDINTPWLKEYIEAVIKDFQVQLCHF